MNGVKTAEYISGLVFDNKLQPESYLCELPVIRYLSANGRLDFSSNVTFFVGENGTGKSTLLEAIAVAYGFNAEGGSKNFAFSTNATHSELWQHLTLLRRRYAKDGFFLRAESVYNVATNIDELDEIACGAPYIKDGYGGVSLHHQSHGESFLSIVQHRFGGKGLYILDEPEAALSPMRLMTLMTTMYSLVERESQFIIATHSPMLMTFPNADILEFSSDGIKRVGYKDTAHYQITRRFLENPDRMLQYLLEEQDD